MEEKKVVVIVEVDKTVDHKSGYLVYEKDTKEKRSFHREKLLYALDAARIIFQTKAID